jgi:epoxyqueuosine reductase
MKLPHLTETLKKEAARLGFELTGVCPAVRPPGIARFREWLAAGKAAGMDYLADRADAREHPRHVLEGVRSILMLGMSYRTVEPVPPASDQASGQASVARYAWGRDYHDVIHERLRTLRSFHEKLTPHAAVRGVVDTAPLLEREFAQMAGLGWIGRNSMLLNKRLGSYFFLAALLTSEELVYDEPFEENHCKTCRACIDACPTGALGEDGTVDARRCLSYLSIEHRGPIPDELRESLGDRIFGCDTCQEACPWNGPSDENASVETSSITADPAFFPAEGMNPLCLADLLALDEAGFRKRFRGTPFWRAKRQGVLRNAAIVLSNQAAIR